MGRPGKRYKAQQELFDRASFYELGDAVDILQKMPKTKSALLFRVLVTWMEMD